MKLLAFVLVFLLFGAFYIISNENLALSKKQDALQFGRMYYNWLGELISNAQGITGFLVHADWLPSNKSG